MFENIVDKNHPDDTVLTIVQGSGTLPRSESSRNIRYDEKGVANYKKVNTYDYIIHLRSFEGGLEMANSQGIISPAYTVLRSKIEFAPLFYDAYFHTDEFINHILAKSVEGIRDGRQISYEAFKWLPIPTCNIEEQKKIADLFCVLNKRIKAQLLLVEALKKYKRGLLTTLLNDNSSWQEVTMKDVATGFDYGMGSAAIKFDGTHKYIRITDIDDDTRTYIQENLVSPSNTPEAKYRVNENDILFARTGASVGKSYLYKKDDGELYFAGFLIRASVKSKFDSYFVYLNTLTDNYDKWVKLESMRSGQPGINAEQYKNYSFYCPPIDIQNKIANITQKIESKILYEQEIYVKLLLVKKSMLQKLFI